MDFSYSRWIFLIRGVLCSLLSLQVARSVLELGGGVNLVEFGLNLYLHHVHRQDLHVQSFLEPAAFPHSSLGQILGVLDD
jgi:hypothetical protein